MEPFPVIAEQWKSLSLFPGWAKPEPESAYTWFEAPVEMSGVTVAALFFRGGCYQNQPDRHVTFELIAGIAAHRKRKPLMRVDWKSLTGGHSNQRRWGTKWAGIRVSDTHYHSFDLNWDADRSRMKGESLPVAAEIGEPIQTFVELRDYVGKWFRINNIGIVTQPEWAYDLFANEDPRA